VRGWRNTDADADSYGHGYCDSYSYSYSYSNGYSDSDSYSYSYSSTQGDTFAETPWDSATPAIAGEEQFCRGSCQLPLQIVSAVSVERFGEKI